nr:AMP-dependent synthetase and ligase [uncultured bacterium]
MTTNSVTSAQTRTEAVTLVELLRRRALQQPDRRAYSFLPEAEADGTISLTYGELDRQARSIAARLQAAGAADERVLLLYPPGLDYVAAFFGCLYAGAVAVPAYPPQQNRHLSRLQAIAADAGAKFVLTTSAVLGRFEGKLDHTPSLKALNWLNTDGIERGAEGDWREPLISGDSLAFLQYTSGSTGDPKGVMVSHRNLLHNSSLLAHGFEYTPETVCVSWLPLYHDMGLIGGVLQPLYGGFPALLMSPVSFLRNPYGWLKAISGHRATLSGAPNFAYDLCARKVTAEQRATLDLSSWEVAFTGAEPIRAETLERFAEAFGPCGFRREAFLSCYGLAEATLVVSSGSKSSAPVTLAVSRAELERGRVVTDCDVDNEEMKVVVGCGRGLLDEKLVIAEPESGRECAPGEVGEIWVSSQSVAGGYWGRPEETERTFGARLAGTGEGPFLRTGDLGYMRDGELFVTGRLKDLIILRGRNHYPQDIELTAERSHAGLRQNGGAAFSVEVGGEERLVVVQEVEPRGRVDVAAAIEDLRRAVAAEHEVQAYAVALVRAGEVPRTSSGKIQRRSCRAKFLERGLEIVGEWRASEGSVEAAESAAPEAFEEVEGWLAAQLASRLGVSAAEIDVRQPLARYGLDSLSAVELTYLIESRLGLLLPMADLLEGMSIADIVAEASKQPPAADTRAAAPFETRDDDSHPLTQGQEALWFIYQMAPDSPAYNIPAAMRVTSPLDAEALRRALRRLVERHPSLGATFDEVRGKVVQRHDPRAEVCLREEDAADWSEAELSERLLEEARLPFDLRRGPALRVSLFRRGADEHVLLVVVHHIVADFWSLALLTDELTKFYQAESEGREALLPPPSARYGDFVRWQEAMLSSEAGVRQREYWERQLAGPLPVLNLATDRQRPPAQTFRGASLPFRIGAGLTEGLKSLGRRHDATLYTTLLAAFQTLLHRYTGQEDIVVGSPTAGRSRAEFAGVVGYFVNPLVMRADLSRNPTFAELLGRVRRTVLESFRHQDYPFPLLVKKLQPERDPSRSPIFEVAFVLQKAHAGLNQGLASFAVGEAGAALEMNGLRLESLALDHGVAQFDLMLVVTEAGGELKASLQYNTDLFDAETVARMVGHFETLLGGIVADDTRRLAELGLLTAPEERRLLVELNDTERDYPSGCMHELFEAQAARTPDAVALVCGDERLTYRELNERANRLAHHLRALGVGPEEFVGILLERRVELIIALLATLKAGGAYVPLDPAYPLERLSFMLEDTRAGVLLTQRKLAHLLPQAEAKVVCVDEEADAFAAHDSENPRAVATPVSLGYVIYTSGSTGRPKGVSIEHHSAVTLIHWAKEVFTPAELSSVLASTSICFDLSIFEIFVPLSLGGRVVLAENALQLPELTSEVSLVNTVPSAMAELARGGGLPASVITVNLAGEPLKNMLVQQVYCHLKGGRVLNLYGPSEDTTYSTYTLAPANSDAEPTIGRPIANTQVYLLDAHLRPVPAGVVGELHLGGEGLARGYLRRPGLTSEKFIPDPFGTRPGARLYRTGDLARYLPSGELEYLGRVDNQVKIRGFRIEIGEIESVLSRHEGVREAVVVAREDGPGDKRLVAYLTAANGTTPAVGELRRHILQSLPEYMIPSVFVPLAEMPLTANGKVNRRALPAPASTRADGAVARVAPRTHVEKGLADIWSQLLGLDAVGIHDNFFELGGHSLLATQLVSQVRETFQVELPLRSIFERPTVAELAALTEESARAAQGLQFPPITAAARGESGPLSFAQQRLWFLHQLESGSAFYNIPAAVRLTGALDAEALQRAFDELVRRHESLRTVIREIDGEPRQVVCPVAPVALSRLDLSGMSEADGEAAWRHLAEEEARRPFDLAAGPLLRVSLLKLAEDSHVLLLTMHHIISDGWSLGVMLRELSALLRDFAAGLPSPLPELTIQYGDFVEWQRRCMTSEVLEPQLSYWARQLADAPPVLELPTARPRPSVQSTEGTTRSASLSPTLTAALKALSQEEGTTLFMTLLAAFNVLLGRYARQSDICVGSPVAGRHRGETEDLIGFFVNTLVLRTDLSGAPTFRELLGRVRETCLEAYAHQDVPFERLVEELQPERSLGHTPLFQVTFALQNALSGATELPGLEFAPLATETGSAKFDLSLEMSEEQGALTANVNYNTQLFDEAFIERLMANFEVLLGGVVADPARPLGELPLLTDEETRRVLVGWNDNACDAPRLLAHELFESRAASHPEALAVVAPDGRLTYAELNERANSLAHFLRASGVGPESRVGLLMERGAELLVGMLGVLKAGGAYLPLDPAYPSARLGFMLEDSGASLLLTQERLAAVLPACGTRLVCVDARRDEIARFARTNPEPSAVAENLAYVIYTSGSTGRPKGVQIAHAALLNLIGWHQGSYALAPSDRMTHLAGISFDASVWEVWPALAAGASLYLPDEERRMFPARLLSWLVENGINITFLPTPLAERLMAEVWPESGVALRSVLTGGDRLNKRPHASLPFEVVNHYGPTENTVVTTAGRVASASGQETLPSIGRPVSNTRVYVLDAHGRPVPVGVIGELYVGGDSLARGYLNEARLTAEKFIPDPFGTRPGARLYRTGDLVRFLPDGRLDFVGRADSQVKIRGFRIELGEIEAALAAHTDVRECAVMAREGAGAEKWLAAYVVAAEGVTPRASELRSHLLAELPEYMVPTAFVMLDELPLTPNGKVDHKALPEPEVSASEAGYEGPRTPVEELLCGLWAGLLKVGRVGVEDNFFELGGHSLLATQLVSQVRETFRIELPLRALFESPTVAGLARVVEERLRGGAAALPPVRRVERGGELPLSFAQERLWLIDQLEPDNAAAYNMPAAILMRGPLDIAALERTLTEVVRRHEALRTTVRTENGQPVQFVEPAFAVKLPLTDLRHVAADAREAEARRLAEEEARRPFDLSGGALMRAGLLRLAEEEHVLLFTMHHIVSDGWSVKVLVREVSSLYEAYARGEESPLSELSVQYADYAVWQREWLQGEALDAQLAYWKQQLEGIPPLLELPLDKPRPAVQTFEGGRATLLLPRELRDSLKHLGRGEGATLYMTMLAAFKVLLYRYTGQEDIVVGTPIAGRNRAELESLIGFFINSLALRTDLSGAPSFRELLGRVREVTLGAYAHQDVPFEKVLEELNPERSLNHTPVFQVYFNMLNMGSEELELAGLQAEHFTTPDLGAKFDLTLYVEEQEASLALRLAYNKNLFAHDRMVELLEQFEQLLAQAAASPDSEITRLSLVTPAARAVLPDPTETLSAKWEGTVHGLFAEHARRAPERVALRDKDASWSYGELDARSSQLAQHLRANGIGGATWSRSTRTAAPRSCGR